MEALTYSNRSNARRAAMRLGIERGQIQITVHKFSGGVRFGFIGHEGVPGTRVTTFIADEIKEMPSGVCSSIRAWLNQNPRSSLRELKEVAKAANWNMTTVCCQYYRWRKSLQLGCQMF